MPALRSPEVVLDANGSRSLVAFFAVAASTALVLVVFGSTFLSMVDIWRRSDTFAHGFLVLPAFLYLTWTRRYALVAMPVRPFWPGLLVVAAAGFAWLLAELAGALAPAQFAVIALVPAAVLTVFGWAWLRVLAFPLAFLFFAVPFGEVLVPTLIDWTADFAVAALRLSGVPVFREGNQLLLPTGNWSVIDGCSGIRYLIASLVTGCLYAWLIYRSARRRLLFIVASIVVPLVANWLRAYFIVMLGHLSDNRIATGVDHLIYGWLFFGIVILVLFAVGARWREEVSTGDGSTQDPPSGEGATRGLGAAAGSALIAVALVATAWPVALAALERALPHSGSGLLRIVPSPAWTAGEGFTAWQPSLQAPVGQHVEFARHDTMVAGMRVALYRDQHRGAELVTSANRLVTGDNHSPWYVVAQRTGSIDIGGQPLGYREVLVRADRLLAVRQFYWLNGASTTSDMRAKMMLAVDRLALRGDASAWVLIYAPAESDFDDAAPVLDDYMRARVPALRAGLAEWAK